MRVGLRSKRVEKTFLCGDIRILALTGLWSRNRRVHTLRWNMLANVGSSMASATVNVTSLLSSHGLDLRQMIDVPEVVEAADELDKRLPHPPVTGNNWGTIEDRLDEAMRARLLEFGKAVV